MSTQNIKPHRPHVRDLSVAYLDKITLIATNAIIQHFPNVRFNKPVFHSLQQNKREDLSDLFQKYSSKPVYPYLDQSVKGYTRGYFDSSNTLKGFSFYSKNPDLIGEFFMHSLYVDPKFQGQGIGTSLLQDAFDTAIADGAVTLRLEAPSERIKTHDFYQKMGGIPDNRRLIGKQGKSIQYSFDL
ncbi:MAG: hypothetical protein CMH26_09755 [Micavibrio sp.]|nr:hypothetical protein [Micavibrio sp.]|tara:strand:+ start:251 stop:805 length:555 start_codon:yes stop_codon:yes gene_type:complete